VAAGIDPALTVDPHDRRAWVDGLLRLLTDRPHAEMMRAKIRAFGEATSWERVGAQHLALYRGLVGRASALRRSA
jgi:glycosyltransferase involved in cell wall biosynthesis